MATGGVASRFAPKYAAQWTSYRLLIMRGLSHRSQIQPKLELTVMLTLFDSVAEGGNRVTP
jgi:hypothetical protein